MKELTPQKATYRYKTTDFQGGYIPFESRVEVIGESDKSYLIRFLEFSARGHRPGDTARVGKKSVTLNKTTPAARFQEYRLPYKDN